MELCKVLVILRDSLSFFCDSEQKGIITTKAVNVIHLTDGTNKLACHVIFRDESECLERDESEVSLGFCESIRLILLLSGRDYPVSIKVFTSLCVVLSQKNGDVITQTRYKINKTK